MSGAAGASIRGGTSQQPAEQRRHPGRPGSTHQTLQGSPALQMASPSPGSPVAAAARTLSVGRLRRARSLVAWVGGTYSFISCAAHGEGGEGHAAGRLHDVCSDEAGTARLSASTPRHAMRLHPAAPAPPTRPAVTPASPFHPATPARWPPRRVAAWGRARLQPWGASARCAGGGGGGRRSWCRRRGRHGCAKRQFFNFPPSPPARHDIQDGLNHGVAAAAAREAREAGRHAAAAAAAGRGHNLK